MSRSTQELLREAFVHREVANQYASDQDRLVIDAMCMRLSAGIEVLARLDSHVRSKLFGENWQFMWGMRSGLIVNHRGEAASGDAWAESGGAACVGSSDPAGTRECDVGVRRHFHR